ncbi:MAG: hypothetical protein DSY91_02010 [Deltaproteobacteria bacterium]|nr:MAG: hypothetical protein DSY91_02010 [Deltaproteobacteria bacterium]
MKTDGKMFSKVSAKGWVVIPAPLRLKYGIKPGTRIRIEEMNGKIVLNPEADNPIQECFGKYADKHSLTKALLEERKVERKREEEKGIRS